MLLNTAYQEVIYHLIALTVCLEVVTEQTAEASVREDDIAWWKRPRPQAAPAPAAGMGRV